MLNHAKPHRLFSSAFFPRACGNYTTVNIIQMDNKKKDKVVISLYYQRCQGRNGKTALSFNEGLF